MSKITNSHYDVIVIGLGAMGSATLYQLAKLKKSVLGIEQFAAPNELGASSGNTRIYRQATAEGPEYVPLAKRTLEIWEDIESHTHTNLFLRSGTILIGDSSEIDKSTSFLHKTLLIANQFNIPHQILTFTEIKKKFSQFKVTNQSIAYLEENSGFSFSSACILTQLKLAKYYGANIRENEKVLGIDNKSAQIQVDTTHGRYFCEKIILCAGSWIIDFISHDLSSLFKICQQIFFWFDIANHYPNFKPDKFPAFIWNLGENKNIYGIPAVNGTKGGIRLTTEYENIRSTDEMSNMFKKFVAPYINQVQFKCLKSVPCRCISTSDSDFIIDYYPTDKRILLVSACSGHGFKSSAAVGEMCAELMTTGHSKFDWSKFQLKRFN